LTAVGAVAAATVVSALLAGCAPWLAANPQFASDAARNPGDGPVTSTVAAGPPAIAAPRNDLTWRDCTAKGFGDAGIPAIPGVAMECADYDADLDPVSGATGTLSIGVMRARSVQTPPDAGPLVFTTGSDLPSSLQLPVWLSRSGADVLRARPIVAVDRRGMGLSSPIDCRDEFDRLQMREQTQFTAGDDPVASLGAITTTATTGCTDVIAPGDSAYTTLAQPRIWKGCAVSGMCPRWPCWASATVRRSRWPTPVPIPKKWPGWCWTPPSRPG
jgi:hypothetical protein